MLITLRVRVFCSLHVVSGSADGPQNLARLGGVMLCGRMTPIRTVALTEFRPGSPLKRLARRLKLMCFRFPFAGLSRAFMIQPLVRTLFRLLMDRGKPWQG